MYLTCILNYIQYTLRLNYPKEQGKAKALFLTSELPAPSIRHLAQLQWLPILPILSLHKLQRRGAFIAAFTSEKQWMTIQKSVFLNWRLIPTFFIAHMPILARCKTNGAVRAVWALLCNWQLGV